MPTTAENTFIDIRGRVARFLLEYAGDDTGEKPRMAQRDIAEKVGTDWGMVHISLESMRADGVIRIDRNRLIIDKKRLRELVGIKE
jgi:CRP-like cAMP-binding protein